MSSEQNEGAGRLFLDRFVAKRDHTTGHTHTIVALFVLEKGTASSKDGDTEFGGHTIFLTKSFESVFP